MKISQQHTEVLIVGAGPSGLMMAAQLLRYGLQPVIIDSRLGPTEHSKALAVQARSLEIYRQMGIVDKVLAEGKPAEGFAVHRNGSKEAELLWNNVGPVSTRYPFIFMYPQSRNERDLLDFLTQNCCPVYWDSSLVSLKQDTDKVTVTIKSAEAEHMLTADWVIGADGSHSPVRKHLNIPFNGDTYNHTFYLIDGKPTEEFDNDLVRVFLSDKGLAGFFPMPDGYYRIMSNLPEGFPANGNNLKLDDLLPSLRQITNREIGISDCRWLITYKLHHRMAGQFRHGRCFLIGDAAHIHSPVGGQGMNTGLQDGYNLAWKLAGVVNGKLRPEILDTFPAERMPVAGALLKTTDRAFNFAMSNSFLARLFKRYFFAGILSRAWKRESVRNFIFRTVSQTGISYRDSKLSLHLSQSKEIKAGDRLPCLKIYDEKRHQETDLHEWCTKPGFTLILLGKIIEEELFMIAKWLTQRYNGFINFYYLPPSDKNRHVFNAFEIGEGQHRSLLVRPDMHIGFMNDAIDLDRMDKYLQQMVGLQ